MIGNLRLYNRNRKLRVEDLGDLSSLLKLKDKTLTEHADYTETIKFIYIFYSNMKHLLIMKLVYN